MRFRPCPRPSAAARPFRTSTYLAACAATAVLAGCDIVTALEDLPIIDTRWVLPADETRFGVADLLPSAVSITTTEDAFLVNFAPVTFSETLGGLCPACIPANGLNVPKPPFAESFESALAFPSDVSSATVVSGSIGLQLFNGTNFDILRPAAGAFGTIQITIEDDADGDVLGTLTIDGTVTPFPGGSTLVRSIALSSATVNGSLSATVDVVSPLGDAVTIDITDQLSATATPTDIEVSSVTVDVAGRTVSLEPVDLELDLPDEVVDAVQGGSVLVDVINPFGVAVDMDLTIDGPDFAPILKSVALTSAPSSTLTVDFTVAELQAILGASSAVLTGIGAVDPGAGPITVTPGQELIITTEIDVTLRAEQQGT